GVLRAGRLHDDPPLEGLLGGRAGERRVVELDAADEAEAPLLAAERAVDRLELRLRERRLALDLAGEVVVRPIVLEGRAGGHEGEVVSAEGAVVLAGLEDVELGAEENHREG